MIHYLYLHVFEHGHFVQSPTYEVLNMNYSLMDLYYLYHPYFSLIYLDSGGCEIQSKNTGHFWKIISERGYYRLFHKYKLSDSYHSQTSCGSIEDCLLNIVDHAEYILRKKHIYLSDCPGLFQEIINTYASYPL